jgi:ribosomal protein S18 acetylase RimI-like enzyme
MRATPSAGGVSIRRCTAAHAPELAALGARLFTQAYGDTHPEPELTPYLTREFDVAALASELRSPAVTALILRDERDAAIGYVLMREAPPPAGARIAPARAVEIVRFYVEDAWHGRGVARAMMEECFAEGARRGATVIWLAAWQRAPRALAFYAKCGFEVVGTAVFHFGDRLDDDFVMARVLPRSSG